MIKKFDLLRRMSFKSEQWDAVLRCARRIIPSKEGMRATMKIAEIALESGACDFWRWLKQIGIDHACGVLPRASDVEWDTSAERPWDYGPLAKYRDSLGDVGLKLSVFEDVPPMQKTKLGLGGRDEEIENLKLLISNLGRLNVPVLVYDWWAGLSWQRTAYSAPGRGGASVSSYAFDKQNHELLTPLGNVSHDQLWAALAYFLNEVIPVAEKWGVKLAMHPDDPPLKSIRGVGRIMASMEDFYRLLELNKSEANGITFCQGNFSLMVDDIATAIKCIGSTGRMYYVHFRDVIGTAHNFSECFHNDRPETMRSAIEAYRDVGYEGFARTDHVPLLSGDRANIAGYGQISRLHAIGYTQGLIDGQYACGTNLSIPPQCPSTS